MSYCYSKENLLEFPRYKLDFIAKQWKIGGITKKRKHELVDIICAHCCNKEPRNYIDPVSIAKPKWQQQRQKILSKEQRRNDNTQLSKKDKDIREAVGVRNWRQRRIFQQAEVDRKAERERLRKCRRNFLENRRRNLLENRRRNYIESNMNRNAPIRNRLPHVCSGRRSVSGIRIMNNLPPISLEQLNVLTKKEQIESLEEYIEIAQRTAEIKMKMIMNELREYISRIVKLIKRETINNSNGVGSNSNTKLVNNGEVSDIDSTKIINKNKKKSAVDLTCAGGISTVNTEHENNVDINKETDIDCKLNNGDDSLNAVGNELNENTNNDISVAKDNEMETDTCMEHEKDVVDVGLENVEKSPSVVIVSTNYFKNKRKNQQNGVKNKVMCC